jgi:hypothetical protein
VRCFQSFGLEKRRQKHEDGEETKKDLAAVILMVFLLLIGVPVATQIREKT